MLEADREPGARLLEAAAQAAPMGPVRVVAVNAQQRSVLETCREAEVRGLAEPLLIGERAAIVDIAAEIGWKVDPSRVIAAEDEAGAAAKAVSLVRSGRADVVMKGYLHTNTFMRALLDSERGLRVPGGRVSHVFVSDVPSYPKLLHITDAAINIAPDLNAKAQIVQNAVDFAALLGVEPAKVAALSAVETVNPAIASTLDAACLTLMAQRGQIGGAVVDGPLGFDNAISATAAREKGIDSAVAGDADILLVPDLISGNVLAKNLEYLAGAMVAGLVLGLSAPVVLSSRADPAPARLAALAIAALMHHRGAAPARTPGVTEAEASVHCAAQPEAACCPLPPVTSTAA
ncbi:MAG: bifunctional enoyl-CoA hydratase/phosphate acetyltransferase [Gammaproteobacteria bacterium]|nr:bifunctional enoyl-CoA hydratase/phosphate acetyltransferase [Gammaproteobacteria bacterium]NIR84360.1 bifunctional enoyl-CoA hydratase/phosphate acetyltransferase [Gammaproteobacteria bacterium]NIR89876.1 bifunctional enoyl-CoA hydratase/phosphate acetyltransferase [Gammaproteobacteria bacterium]NIU05743.1 bifunctional enoyl-CoA hydratase/phosphate acetyltransferase [Gammaproteobacteria bacterium]NIV52503.1 bifunctional enoyl-CoA hydratase/phosphate acetyltransferase [Gammaproteobacteria ba